MSDKNDSVFADYDPTPFQERCSDWAVETFGVPIAGDIRERNIRFIEEALELVQSLDMTREEAQIALDYVFSRKKGEPYQELGGTMITLAILSTANCLDMVECGEIELRRAWEKKDHIRAKWATKPDNMKNALKV